jgi:hypothetical protein
MTYLVISSDIDDCAYVNASYEDLRLARMAAAAIKGERPELDRVVLAEVVEVVE